MLLPTASAEAVSVWQPHYAKVQWRLQLVDEEETFLPVIWPNVPRFPSGDVSSHLLLWADYPYSPTSGNAFARRVLKEILPMPEKEWRIASDAYLLMLAPLYGDICSLHTILTYYRVHGSNAWYTDSHALNEQAIPKLLHQIRIDEAKRQLLAKAAKKMGLVFKGRTIPTVAKLKLGLAVLAPAELNAVTHARVKRIRIASAGIYSTLFSPYTPGLTAKIRLVIWFAAAALLPVSMARPLVKLGLFPSTRPRRLAALLRATAKNPDQR